MLRHRVSSLFVLVAACGTPSAPSPGPETQVEVEDLFPEMCPVDGQGHQTHLVFRVVDAATGRPVAGARVHRVAEADCPLPGVWQAQRTVTTDGEGFARLPRRPGDGAWIFVEAPGRGVFAEFGEPDEVALVPGFDVHLRVVDPLGAPVPGVAIDFLLGCGHAPAIRTVTTDAAGLATIPDAGDNPIRDLWPVKAGFVSRYYKLTRDEWLPDGPVHTIRLDPGPVIEGTLLDRAGRPLADWPIGRPECHRGPWTRTDSLGRFRIVGGNDPYPLQAKLPGPEWATMEFQPPPPGSPCVVRLDPSLLEIVEGTELVVQVRDAADSQAVPGLPVCAVRVADGFTGRGETDDAGNVAFALPVGVYRVLAGGPLASHELTARELPVVAQKTATVELQARRNPRAPGAPAVAPPAPAPEPAPLRVRGRLLDAQGQPVVGSVRMARKPMLAWPEDAEDPGVPITPDGFEATTELSGRLHLFAATGAGAARRVLVVPLEAAASSSGPLELGDLRLPPRAPRRLRLTDPAGQPVAGRVHLQRGPFALSAGITGGELEPSFAEQLAPGDELLIVPEQGHLPLRHRLAGDGPWTVSLPAGRITVTASLAGATEPPSFGVLCDDCPRPTWSMDEHVVELRGVSAGRHRVRIYGVDTRAQVLDLELREGEHRRLDVRLTRR